MLVMMESIQQRIVENGQKGKATWLYIDEFHVLLNSEYSAKYLQQLWKKVRKQGGLCTGITQNVVDLLQNYTATTMLANSEFVALLKQANTDSVKMAEVVGISQAQLRYVTNTASGMGLIKCGTVVIPFDNQISKDTDLYKLYNTNIHEKIAEQKAREEAGEFVEDDVKEYKTAKTKRETEGSENKMDTQEKIEPPIVKKHTMGTFVG